MLPLFRREASPDPVCGCFIHRRKTQKPSCAQYILLSNPLSFLLPNPLSFLLPNPLSCLLSNIYALFCRAKRFHKRQANRTMNFKLPHVVVSTCAKRDEPPSRRRPSRFSLDQNNILSTNSSEPWPTSARHSVSSVYSVDYPKLVFIRVNSWFLKNDLVAAKAAPGDLWFP